MKEIITNGTYNITYKNIEQSYKSGNKYSVDDETAKMLVESGYANYAELEKSGKAKSTKTNSDKQ